MDWQRYRLTNGTPVLAVHAPNAKRQALFNFQPIGLVDDLPAHAQFSHLLEHMIIRITEKGRLNKWGMEINGETTGNTMRLEIFSDPTMWDDSLEKHSMWLRAGQLDGARLPAEKQAIAEEERSVSQSGFTGKFALAAWNQVVRQGLDAASVHADVQGAAIEPVLLMLNSRRAVGPSMMLAAIGPMDLQKVHDSLEHAFGSLHPVQPAVPPAVSTGPALLKPFRASWDLPTKHMMKWWIISSAHTGDIKRKYAATLAEQESERRTADRPKSNETQPSEHPASAPMPESSAHPALLPVTNQAATTPESSPASGQALQARKDMDRLVRLRAVLACAARAVQTRVSTSALAREGVIRSSLVTGGLDTASGELLFMVDCCVRADADESAVWTGIDSALQAITGSGPAPASAPDADQAARTARENGERLMRMCAGMIVMEMGTRPDLDRLKTQVPSPRMLDFFEGGWLLPRAYIEFEWGVPFEHAIDAIRTLDSDAILHVQDRVGEPGGSLVLEPPR